MTTGRINQVATSRPAHQPWPKPRPPLEHPTRCPHLSGCPTGPTVPADGQSVFHRDQITVVSESVKKPRTNPRLPSRAKPGDPCEGLFVLPSCIFPKHQLSWSCRGRAPPAVGSCAADICVARSASRGPSGRCAIVGLRCAVRAASLLSRGCRRRCLTPSVR